MGKEKNTESNVITVIDDKSDSGIFANIIGLTKGKELVLKNLDRLIKGELDEPIDTRAPIMHTRIILKELEKLRLKMLTDKIAYEEQVDSFNDQIAGVAHDLKTPIATIAGYAECMQDGFDDKDYPALISERAKVMNGHVISLVNRIRANHEERERTLVRAYGYFASVFQGLMPVAEAKKIKLTVKKIPKVSLYIDMKQIGRVCQNIVSNAVNATKEGGKITVKFRTTGNTSILK